MALSRASEVVGEGGPQTDGDVSIENAQADLIVQLEGSVVEVRRADARPHAVDDDDFLMQQSRLILPDLHTVLQQRSVLMMAGVLHARTICRAGRGHTDLDVDASLHRVT